MKSRKEISSQVISELIKIEAIAAQVPDMWNNFRYDYFTYRAAEAAIRVIQPRVLFVNFGETDEWGMVVAMTCTSMLPDETICTFARYGKRCNRSSSITIRRR